MPLTSQSKHCSWNSSLLWFSVGASIRALSCKAVSQGETISAMLSAMDTVQSAEFSWFPTSLHRRVCNLYTPCACFRNTWNAFKAATFPPATLAPGHCYVNVRPKISRSPKSPRGDSPAEKCCRCATLLEPFGWRFVLCWQLPLLESQLINQQIWEATIWAGRGSIRAQSSRRPKDGWGLT